MEVIKLAAIGILACLMCVYTARDNKDIALIISLCAGIIIISAGLKYLSAALTVISNFDTASIIADGQLEIIMKIIVTAYIAQFACDICNDAGYKSIASKIELSAKFIIVYLTLPVLLSLFDYLTSLV